MKTCFQIIQLGALAGFISCGGVYLSAQSPHKQESRRPARVPPQDPQHPKDSAHSEADCSGCLNGTRDDCLQCHNFTYNLPMQGCTDCWNGGELASKARAKKGFVYVVGKDTGKTMQLISDWQTITLPVGHRQLAQEARRKVADCKGRKITE